MKSFFPFSFLCLLLAVYLSFFFSCFSATSSAYRNDLSVSWTSPEFYSNITDFDSGLPYAANPWLFVNSVPPDVAFWYNLLVNTTDGSLVANLSLTADQTASAGVDGLPFSPLSVSPSGMILFVAGTFSEQPDNIFHTYSPSLSAYSFDPSFTTSPSQGPSTKLLWKRTDLFGQYSGSNFLKVRPVSDDLIVVTAEGWTFCNISYPSNGTLLGLNATTGETVWSFEPPANSSLYSSVCANYLSTIVWNGTDSSSLFTVYENPFISLYAVSISTADGTMRFTTPLPSETNLCFQKATLNNALQSYDSSIVLWIDINYQFRSACPWNVWSLSASTGQVEWRSKVTGLHGVFAANFIVDENLARYGVFYGVASSLNSQATDQSSMAVAVVSVSSGYLSPGQVMYVANLTSIIINGTNDQTFGMNLPISAFQRGIHNSSLLIPRYTVDSSIVEWSFYMLTTNASGPVTYVSDVLSPVPDSKSKGGPGAVYYAASAYDAFHDSLLVTRCVTVLTGASFYGAAHLSAVQFRPPSSPAWIIPVGVVLVVFGISAVVVIVIGVWVVRRRRLRNSYTSL